MQAKPVTLIFLALILTGFAGCFAPDAEYPPGTSGDEITNASVLVDQHQKAIQGSDYSMNGSGTGLWYRNDIYYWFRVDTDSETSMYISQQANSNLSYRTYISNGTIYTRDRAVRRTSWSSRRSVEPDVYWSDPENIYTELVVPILVETKLTATETVEQNGQTFIRYEPAYDEEATTGHLLVREDGFIRRISLSDIDPSSDTALHSLELTFYLTNQSHISAPVWKDRAAENVFVRHYNQGSSGGGIVGDADCEDFSTQAAAQRYHERHGDDNLDGDDDGRACEHLP